MSDLILHLEAKYWHDINNGIKPEEYRERTPYWEKRLKAKQFDNVIFCLGYPAKDDMSKRIIRPYKGYKEKTIIHPHFGNKPTDVFAIDTRG